MIMRKTMTTLEIEVALMEYFLPGNFVIVPNVSWGMRFEKHTKDLHECDLLILSRSRYATEIEIKISKADILKDKKKRHGHHHNHIARLYFAVPEKLADFALQHIPRRAGLYSILKDKRRKPRLVKHCIRNKNCVKWTEKDKLCLARLGALRVLGLKSKIHKLTKGK